MKLTGSFQTMVTQGLSDTGLSADRGRSTSAGAALTTTHLPLRSLPPVTNPVNHQPPPGADLPGTALLTDQYELTMVQGSLRSGAADRRAVFEGFARHLPHGRRYGVAAGTRWPPDPLYPVRFCPAAPGVRVAPGVLHDPPP